MNAFRWNRRWNCTGSKHLGQETWNIKQSSPEAEERDRSRGGWDFSDTHDGIGCNDLGPSQKLTFLCIILIKLDFTKTQWGCLKITEVKIKEGLYVRRKRNNTRTTPDKTRWEGLLGTIIALADVVHSTKGCPLKNRQKQMVLKLCTYTLSV